MLLSLCIIMRVSGREILSCLSSAMGAGARDLRYGEQGRVICSPYERQ